MLSRKASSQLDFQVVLQRIKDNDMDAADRGAHATPWLLWTHPAVLATGFGFLPGIDRCRPKTCFWPVVSMLHLALHKQVCWQSASGSHWLQDDHWSQVHQEAPDPITVPGTMPPCSFLSNAVTDLVR